MIIAIDFDGTICRGQYPNIDGLQLDAKKYIQKLKADGHYIIIYTCRCGDYLTQVINWLLENEIPFDRVNDNEPKSTALYKHNSRKVYAHIYVDDKQVGGLPTWGEIYEYITQKQWEYENKH